MHCLEPACVEVCPEGAISKRSQDGIVVVDRDKCVGCQVCLEACPFEVPAFGTDEKMQKCDMCLNRIEVNAESPPCVETCPTEALTFGKMEKQERRDMEEAMRELVAMI
jgi:Fe-S-cluster-containing dehydrogenase component